MDYFTILNKTRVYFLCEMFGWNLSFKRITIRRYYFPSKLCVWQELARAARPFFARVGISHFCRFCSEKQVVFLLCFLLRPWNWGCWQIAQLHPLKSYRWQGKCHSNYWWKEQTYEMPKEKSFSSIAGWASQPRWSGPMAAVPLSPRPAALRKREGRRWRMRSQLLRGRADPHPALPAPCSGTEAAGRCTSEYFSHSRSCWERFLFLLSHAVLWQFRFS